MSPDDVLKVLEKLLDGSLGNTGIVLAFLVIFVMRPLNRGLAGLSKYIKTFLAIERRRARALEKLDGTISQLVEYLER